MPARSEPEKRPSDPAQQRRAAEADAEARRNRFFSGGGSSGISAFGGAVFSLPSSKPVSMDMLAKEIVHLRVRARQSETTDPEGAQALRNRAANLSTAWCERAHAKGMRPPNGSFDPFRATDKELHDALLWAEVGNTLPLSRAHDGGAQYRAELVSAQIVRSPQLLARAVEATRKNPEVLLPMIHRELDRLGERTPCKPGDDVDALLRRVAVLQARARTDEMKERDEEDRLRPTMGLDGRIGTHEQIVAYEIVELALAANPGTAFGAVGAAAASVLGGSIEDMRAAGQAGNALQTLLRGNAASNIANDGALVSPQPAFRAAPTPRPTYR